MAESEPRPARPAQDASAADAAADSRNLLARLVARARLMLAWERTWPRLSLPLGVVALFLATVWFGAFEPLPFAGRVTLAILFALAFIAAAVPLARLRWPDAHDSLGRVDRAANLPHRPASALGDSLANAPSDPVSRALWAAHQRDAEAKMRAVRLGVPAPGLPALDRYGLRFAVVLALIAGFFYAGPERLARLTGVFAPTRVALAVPGGVRIDAWVTPPAYTRRAPIMLSTADTAPVTVPQNSVLVVRVAGDAKAQIVASGKAEDVAPAATTAPVDTPAALVEKRLALKGDAAVAVRRDGRDAGLFRFAIIPDKPPVIAFDGPPKPSMRGAMTLAYKVEDDYGATGAEARVTLPPAGGARPLYEPPKITLPLPPGRTHSGSASATRDVSEHPFAGGIVSMTLVARDDAGNEGRSETQTMTLPGRVFVKPVARALIEQRRKLAMDANQAPMVKEALDALMIAPDRFTKDANVYLGLRTAWVRLDNARTDEQLRDVAQYLWQIALRIEEGNLSEAERELKAARQALRDALQRGASPEEIQRLTKELREAMNKFMREYAQRLDRQRRNGELTRDPLRPQRFITQDELNAMLDRMERSARNGDKDQAEQLLSELDNLLDNLASPEMGEMAQDPASEEMQRSLDEMSKMIQRQQRLRDQTFRNRQGQDGQQQDGQQQDGQQDQAQNGQEGQDAQQGQEGGDQQGGMNGLRQRQESLRKQLEAMRKRLEQMGVPGGDELGQAEQAMRDAEGQLGRGEGEGAVGSQGRAIEALRRGAQGLARQMEQAQNGRPGGQPGRAQRNGRSGPNGEDRDPLGRPMRNNGYADDNTVKVPGRNETGVERAARVLEELRRRLADPSRPQLELDYIDRLLRRE